VRRRALVGLLELYASEWGAGRSAAKRAGSAVPGFEPAQARNQGKCRNEGGEARHQALAALLVVAASPHSNAKSHFDPLGGRDVARGRSARRFSGCRGQADSAGRCRRAVDLPRHEARRELDDMRLETEMAQGVGGFETKETTADDGVGPLARKCDKI
jgi:hypothetical protein